jgi:hypothetical protein
MPYLSPPESTADYDDWLKAEVQASVDDPGTSIPHEEVMQRMFAQIATLQREQEKRRT